jgi:hypothetical protein
MHVTSHAATEVPSFGFEDRLGTSSQGDSASFSFSALTAAPAEG